MKKKTAILQTEQDHMRVSLAENLRKCRESKGLSYERLSQELKDNCGVTVSKQALMSYEVVDKYHTKYQKGFGMGIRYLWAFARYFNVSTDWLLGLSNVASSDLEVADICSKTELSEKAVDFLVCPAPMPTRKSLDAIYAYEGKYGDGYLDGFDYRAKKTINALLENPVLLNKLSWAIFEYCEQRYRLDNQITFPGRSKASKIPKSDLAKEIENNDREKAVAHERREAKKVASLLFNVTYEFTKFIEGLSLDKKLKTLNVVDEGN